VDNINNYRQREAAKESTKLKPRNGYRIYFGARVAILKQQQGTIIDEVRLYIKELCILPTERKRVLYDYQNKQ
jgi:hypothetical protein